MFGTIDIAYGSYLLAAKLPVSPTSWFPIALAAVLAVISIAAFVYMLSGAIGSQNARNWSRMQIYEAFLSIVFILAFGAFSYVFFTNPTPALSSVNLVPSVCTSPSLSNLPAATDMTTLAVCDVSVFNSASYNFAGILYSISYVSALIPELLIGVGLPPQRTYQLFGFTLRIPTPFQQGLISSMSMIYGGFLFMTMLNQLQLMLLASSLLLFATFMSIGLIARTFGFSRSFGGAMIAFGLGLGVIFPLVASLTYGFVDVNANLGAFVTCIGQAGGVGCRNNLLTQYTGILHAIIDAIFSSPSAAIHGDGLGFLTQAIYIIAGLTFIPFLNFTIVDAFVVDFSQAIGERMSFITLLGNFI